MGLFGKGGIGNVLGGNSEILFFILVFLLLFWGNGTTGVCNDIC